MCFDLDSSPPIPAIAGAAISHDDLVLRAADGNEFAAERASWSSSIGSPCILALQAGDDQGITAEDNAVFDRALTDAGVEHEIVVYEGAPHSFFDRKQEEFADSSDDAWRRTLAFIDGHR